MTLWDAQRLSTEMHVLQSTRLECDCTHHATTRHTRILATEYLPIKPVGVRTYLMRWAPVLQEGYSSSLLKVMG